MKKVIVSLITAMMLTVSLVSPFVGGTPEVYAYSDGSLAQRFVATGNYGIVSAGVGLDGGQSDTIADFNIPVGSSIVQAYLYWAGYDGCSDRDDFDSARLSVDGHQGIRVDAIDYGVGDWGSGSSHFVFVADVTSLCVHKSNQLLSN